MVPHALEVHDHREHGDHDAQVARHRALLGEQVQHLVVELEALAVHLAVVAHHRVGERDIALDERDDRPLDLAIDHRAHLEQAVLELVEVGLELLSRHLLWCSDLAVAVLLPVGSPAVRAAANATRGRPRGAASGTSRSGR